MPSCWPIRLRSWRLSWPAGRLCDWTGCGIRRYCAARGTRIARACLRSHSRLAGLAATTRSCFGRRAWSCPPVLPAACESWQQPCRSLANVALQTTGLPTTRGGCAGLIHDQRRFQPPFHKPATAASARRGQQSRSRLSGRWGESSPLRLVRWRQSWPSVVQSAASSLARRSAFTTQLNFRRRIALLRAARAWRPHPYRSPFCCSRRLHAADLRRRRA